MAVIPEVRDDLRTATVMGADRQGTDMALDLARIAVVNKAVAPFLVERDHLPFPEDTLGETALLEKADDLLRKDCGVTSHETISAANNELAKEEAKIIGIIGDGVTGAMAASELAKLRDSNDRQKYRVVVFGKSPGGQAVEMIDTTTHEDLRLNGGAKLTMKRLSQPGIYYVYADVDMNNLSGLVDQFNLSGLIVAGGGYERLNEAVDYSLQGIYAGRDFISLYHQTLGRGEALTDIDLGLAQKDNSRLTFLIQGAGRMTQDIIVKVRMLQVASLLKRYHIDVENLDFRRLFKVPFDGDNKKLNIAEESRLLWYVKQFGLDHAQLAEVTLVHRGRAKDFRYEEPAKGEIHKIATLSESEIESDNEFVDAFAAFSQTLKDKMGDQSLTPKQCAYYWIRAQSEFQKMEEAEVQKWLDGYQLGLEEEMNVIGISRRDDGRLDIALRPKSRKDETEDVVKVYDVFISAIGSKGTEVSQHIVRKDGVVVTVMAAGMALDGRGLVSDSTDSGKWAAEEVNRILDQREEDKLGAASPENDSIIVFDAAVEVHIEEEKEKENQFARAMQAISAAQQTDPYHGNPALVLLANRNNRDLLRKYFSQN